MRAVAAEGFNNDRFGGGMAENGLLLVGFVAETDKEKLVDVALAERGKEFCELRVVEGGEEVLFLHEPAKFERDFDSGNSDDGFIARGDEGVGGLDTLAVFAREPSCFAEGIALYADYGRAYKHGDGGAMQCG